MHLDDVRSALADQAAHVPPPRAVRDVVMARARRRRRHRRVLATVAVGAMVVALIAGVGIALAVRSPSGSRLVVTGQGTAPGARSLAPVTDEELRAHDGADAPSGWEPVDGGNARVFVPSDWLVEAGGTCVGGGSAQGIVSIGRLVHAGCQPAGQWPVPEQAVSLIPMATVPSVAPAQVVHGYRVYLAARSSLEWRVYDVPQLGVALYLRGTLGDRVLATLAPSALKVAVTVASEPVPRGHRITTDGVAMTLPPAWRVTTATWRPCSWMSASPNGTAWVERIPPGLGVPSCPAPWLTAVNTIHEGMFLYTSPASGGPSQPATSPAAVLHHGSSTVRVYPDDADPRVLDVFVHREGSRETRVLQLGLGRDGRVVGGILASLAAVS